MRPKCNVCGGRGAVYPNDVARWTQGSTTRCEACKGTGRERPEEEIRREREEFRREREKRRREAPSERKRVLHQIKNSIILSLIIFLLVVFLDWITNVFPLVTEWDIFVDVFMLIKAIGVGSFLVFIFQLIQYVRTYLY